MNRTTVVLAILFLALLMLACQGAAMVPDAELLEWVASP